MGFDEKRQKFNPKLLTMKILFIFIFLFNTSCNSADGDPKSVQVSSKSSQELQLKSIQCFYVSLDGKEKIYEISKGNLFAYNKTTKLNLKEYQFLKNVPDLIKKENQKYGCGACIDSTDFLFIFEFETKTTTLEIQSGYAKLPSEIKNYLGVLIKKYDEQLIN